MAAMGSWCQLCNWGPILALTTIAVISISTIHCDLMWWPMTSIGGFLHLGLFIVIVTMILTNYFRAALVGPGFVPLKWHPPKRADEKSLQFCSICQGYKAPRSHHCRKCDRCVIKMDHHCPWIGTCTGHTNQTYFLLFLFWAPIGCTHALVILVSSMYRALNFHYYVYHGIDAPLVQLGVWSFVACMFASGLAIGVVIAVGLLFVMEFKSALKNRTGIEDWIVEKANDRLENIFLAEQQRRLKEEEERKELHNKADEPVVAASAPAPEPPTFLFPYDLGWRDNLRQVINWKMEPVGDGLFWPVRPGCDQYALTREQLLQKVEKRDRTVVYHAVRGYSGSFFPISFGPRVLWGIPCTDEHRLALDRGEEVRVTRWKQHWLYGEKGVKSTTASGRSSFSSSSRGGGAKNGASKTVVGEKGWFPRLCVAEIRDDDENQSAKKQN